VTVSSFASAAPTAQGLYDPANEHDACGIGFVAHLRGERSYGVIQSGLEMLLNLTHRAATGPDGEVGDGAGILLQLPHALLRSACRGLEIPLPDAGAYGVGMLFLPRHDPARVAAAARIEAAVAAHGCRVLGWRLVPVDDDQVAESVRNSRPSIWQVFVAPSTLDRLDEDGSAFERTLYVIRRSIERDALALIAAGGPSSYVASFSSRTIVYKGLLRPDQLPAFYRDLSNPEAASALALVHSRFSTNTFPSWPLAHPFRYVCHNGEINTMRGNLAWMNAREQSMASTRLPGRMQDVLPVIQPGGSDSASLDNVVELLVQAGRPLAHAMMMLVPEAWERDAAMSPERRAFYDYHSSIMEPWDGPAALAFTDGRQIGAVQDRNGLRPARWIVTDDDIVILSSEAGALPVDAESIREKGRLRPGQLLLVNTTQGRLLHDDEIKSELASLRPYRRWVAEQRIELSALVAAQAGEVRTPATLDDDALLNAQRRFGYTREELSMILAPMATAGEEALGSMGSDTPLAVLSDRPQLLFSYFRQLFAQVTNPPIDPIREALVMSVRMRLGPQGNLLDETPEHARQVDVEHPVLTPAGIAALRSIDDSTLRPITLSTVFSPANANRLSDAVDALCASALDAVRAGHGIIILSDRAAADGLEPMPSLLAVSAVHHHLIRAGVRSAVSLVVEAADAREVSHVALLFSYGAAAVSPYLALETCAAMARDGSLGASIDEAAAQANYVYAVEKGLLKVFSKMGVSTLQSYCGAQLWESVGLAIPMIARHFTGTSSKLGGIDLPIIAEEVLRRSARANSRTDTLLDAGGEYHYRAKGERHAWNPGTIVTLQRATREGSYSTFREFTKLANEEQTSAASLRGMLGFTDGEPVSLDEVEPATTIVRRFVSGAM
jgi:glutamate synthase domain-containing protein 1